MNEGITADERLTIGLDLGDKFSEACVLGAAGEVVESFRVRTTQPGLERALAGSPPRASSWRWERTPRG